MSIKVMSEVWSSSREKGSKLLLLLAIADNSNEDRVCWPGISYLAKKIRMDERTVQRLIKELATDWELAIEYGAGRGRTHLFYVLTGLTENQKIAIKSEVDNKNKLSGIHGPELNGDKLSPPESIPNGDKLSLNGDKTGLKGDKAMSPESLTVNPKNDINKELLKHNTESKYFKAWEASLQQLGCQLKTPDRDPRFIMIRDNLYFIDYDPEIHAITTRISRLVSDKISAILNSGFYLTLGRYFSAFTGTGSDLPELKIQYAEDLEREAIND